MYGDAAVGVAHITLLAGDVAVQSGPLPDVDLCHVLRKDPVGTSKSSSVTTEVAQVGLTPRGATWVDESLRAVALHELLVRARGARSCRPVAELGPGVVALAGPDGALSAGQTG
jgi:hypothetical protein